MKQFWIIIKDEDKKALNVRGPSTDDTEVTHAVYKAQQAGRQVFCFTIPLDNEPDRQTLIDQCAEKLDLTHTVEPIV
ncbi:MAG: hypothetical protein WD672_15405 [Woeseia sp.]